MIDRMEVAKRLREQKRTIEKLGFALGLMMPQSRSEIDNQVHCVCEWINDACEILSQP